MYPTPAKPGIFPEGRLHHLVQAACGNGDPEAAWHAYASTLTDDYPNEGELRLLPLIADRLGGDVSTQPLAKFLSSAQRWARMQSMINRQLSADLGAVFRAEGVPLMWIKGSALVARIDGRADLRPSSDLDALFRWEDVDRILALAEAKGWKPRLGLNKNRSRARYINTELSFDIGNHGQLDLHWLPRLPFSHDKKLQSWLWNDPTRHADDGGTPYASDTWLMLEIIDHGLNVNTVYPIRWLVDAVRFLEARHASIDWAAFSEIVLRNKLHYSYLIGLQTVAAYSPHVPQSVLDTLRRKRVGLLDRDELQNRINAEDLGDAHRTALALTKLRREPSKRYYTSPPWPLSKRINVSAGTRLAIAGRNLFTRLLFPLWHL